MEKHYTDGDKAWREWYRRKHKLETEKRQLAKEQKEKERKTKEGDQRKKDKQCSETWIAWLQKKEAAKKQEKAKKDLENSSVVRYSKDPIEQKKKVNAWLERKLSAAKRNSLTGFRCTGTLITNGSTVMTTEKVCGPKLSQQEKAEQEKKKQEEITFHKKKCEKAFEEWKKQKENFRRPVSCIITNRDNYEYTGFHHPQPWQD